mmetsp:Transcript_45258/g.106191  ORF Transcript_45258/g.106191 Transcript_45258/m.106191 type:complete len:249 (+) Transcript_45258:446-1192(+)
MAARAAQTPMTTKGRWRSYWRSGSMMSGTTIATPLVAALPIETPEFLCDVGSVSAAYTYMISYGTIEKKRCARIPVWIQNRPSSMMKQRRAAAEREQSAKPAIASRCPTAGCSMRKMASGMPGISMSVTMISSQNCSTEPMCGAAPGSDPSSRIGYRKLCPNTEHPSRHQRETMTVTSKEVGAEANSFRDFETAAQSSCGCSCPGSTGRVERPMLDAVREVCDLASKSTPLTAAIWCSTARTSDSFPW